MSVSERLKKLKNDLLFSWMVPLLQLGAERPLMQSDLYPLEPVDSAKGSMNRTFKIHKKKSLSLVTLMIYLNVFFVQILTLT